MLYKKPSIKVIFSHPKTLSFVNLFVASWLIISIFMFDKFNASLNSTSFKEDPLLIFLFNNTFTDTLYQSFGYYIYFLPFPFLFWSYQYFFNKITKIPNLTIISFVVSFIVIPSTISLSLSEQSGGVLGMFVYQTGLLQSLLPAFIVLSLLIYITSLNVSLMVFVKFILATIEFIIGAIIALFNLTKSLISKTSNIKVALDTSDFKKQPSIDININTSQNNKTKYYGYTKKENNQNDLTKNPTYANKEQTDNNKREIEVKTSYSEQNNKENTEHHQNNKEYYVNLSMFNNKEEQGLDVSKEELIALGQKIEATLNEFGVSGVIDNIQTGPLITLFEFIPASGIKISKVVSLETDLALKLKVKSIRISPVTGKNSLGVEVPNKVRRNVLLGPLIKPDKLKRDYALPLILGKDIAGAPVVVDLTKMPHMLVGGTTGSGKSVSINAMIISLVATLPPKDCKLIMIDPKMLELSVYEDIPHLLTPVVTNPEKAVTALKWAVREMEFRYFMMSQLGVRNIVNYNEKVKEFDTPKTIVRHDLLKMQQDKPLDVKEYEVTVKHLPYIVVVIDEMADLMIVAGKEVEMLVQRLAQMARAAGIHVIMATQRPSVDVITGTIKANFPSRIAFQVSSKIDSRTILGNQGAESLLGKGDMLIMPGGHASKRVHGAFVSDSEVENFVNSIKKNSEKPEYVEGITTEITKQGDDTNSDKDELYEDVIQLITQERKVSTSFIQRKFQIGYNRAARIVDQLEENGIISQPSKTGKRDIYI